MKEGKILFQKNGECMLSFMDALPVLNESCIPKRCKASEDEAYIDIIRKVKRCDEKVTLLFTGPLTDLAKAINYDNSILKI